MNGIVTNQIHDQHRRPTTLGVDVETIARERLIADETGPHRKSRLSTTELWCLRGGAVAGYVALGLVILRMLRL